MSQQSSTTSPLDFLGETLAQASGKFTAGKFTHMVDDLSAAAIKDPTIQFIVLLRKGDSVSLLGVSHGEVIPDNAGFRQVLLPIVTHL